jgi:Cof subfamily protein (haloacid dehalogenase superfamily)
MNRKYIFLDIDGTLYSSRINCIPDSAVEALREARKTGHKVFLCTGRSLAEVSRYLNFEVDGFVMGAGAMIYAEGKRIYDHPMKTADVTEIKKLIDSFGMGYALEGSAGAYCSRSGYESLLWYFGRTEETREKRIRCCMDNAVYPEDRGDETVDKIYKICSFNDCWEPDYPALEKKLKEPYILTKSMALEKDHYYTGEVTDGTINKATAVKRVMEYYQADMKDTIAMGDSGNDIPMLKACRMGIAMGNATDETKRSADYVTTDILDNGIRNAFIHCGLIEGEE